MLLSKLNFALLPDGIACLFSAGWKTTYLDEGARCCDRKGSYTLHANWHGVSVSVPTREAAT